MQVVAMQIYTANTGNKRPKISLLLIDKHTLNNSIVFQRTPKKIKLIFNLWLQKLRNFT